MPDYAWSEIIYGVDRDPDDNKTVVGRKSFKPGEQVDAKKLGISDEEYQELLDIGAVRDYSFPEELQDPMQSPNQKIAEALADAEGVAAAYGVSPELVDAYGKQQKKLQKGGEKEVDPKTGQVKKVS